jgi:acetyl esterase/lipase
MRLAPVTLLALATGCSGGLALDYTDSPLTGSNSEARFAADVSYDDAHEATALDVFHFPDAAAPTGIFVFIHGGGFTGGDKANLYDSLPDVANGFLDQGVAVASVNYRLLEEVDTEGVIKPLTDSARAVQFLRYHAEDLNIDPDRLSVGGVSAGAGTAIWLATHDDLADAAADDPILAMSTRPRAAAAWETQASYDLIQWSDVVYVDFGIDLFDVAASYGLSQRLWSFYGISADAQLFEPEYEAYREDVDMLRQMTADDPPLWLHNVNIAGTYPLSVDALFHHPNHVRALAQFAAQVGIEHEAFAPQIEIGGSVEVDPVDYLMGHMQ